MFISHTPHSELKSSLNNVQQSLGYKTKFKHIERMGRTLGQLLVQKDPVAMDCGRQGCMACRTKEGKCLRQGCIYRMTCLHCLEVDKQSVYIGETARTGYDRSLEHWSAIRRRDETSPLVEHHNLEHPDKEEPDFAMEIISYPKTNLQRQAEEAEQILRHESANLLNRRGEWGQNLPPKLSIEDQSQDDKGKRKTGPRGSDKPKANKRRKCNEAQEEVKGTHDPPPPPPTSTPSSCPPPIPTGSQRVQQKGRKSDKATDHTAPPKHERKAFAHVTSFVPRDDENK